MPSEKYFLESEVNLLQDLLASTPAARLIERMSLQARLENVQAKLVALPELSPVQKVKLTFRGRPVFGSQGIVADFGSQATAAFADAFATIAAGLDGSLNDAGPIPNRNRNELLITGTAIGSFGFELELPAPHAQQPLFPEEAAPETAMLKMEALLRLAATGSDDDLAEVIEQAHPRAVRKVYEFVDFLAKSEALCGLEFGNHIFRHLDDEQVRLSCERLRDDNIQERDDIYQGEFEGVLPTGRTFEFRIANQNELIKGKIDRSIQDPDILNRQWLHRLAIVKFHVMQVGQGRPRYTLMSLDDIEV